MSEHYDESFVGDCGVCGERYDVRSTRSSVADIGEFISPSGTHITCHAECGLQMGLELA